MLPVLVFALSLGAQAKSAPVRPVPAVDLDRYAGRWYEIARFPNRFQSRCASDVMATYEKRSDGRIGVRNECTKADGGATNVEGVARVVEGSGNARLKVRFAPSWLAALPFVWADYWIIGLADDYRWAVVGTPDRKYLWVLGRARTLSPGEWEAALSKGRENGFDLSRLERTTQRSE